MEQTYEDLTQKFKCENEGREMDIEGSQSAFSIEEKIEIKMENKEINSYICRTRLISSEDSSAMKESSTKKAKIKEKNICEICKKSFSTKYTLNLHVKTIHNEVKEHKCDLCGKTFGQNGELQFHATTGHNSIKPHQCSSFDKRFGQKSTLEKHNKSVHHVAKDMNKRML